MTEKHKYEYPVQSHSAPDKVIGMVGLGKRVLELGPGPGSITRHLKANGCGVTALEIDPVAAGIVAQHCERVHLCDLNDPGWPAVLAEVSGFPVIVAADVLEHLYDPLDTLRKTLPLLAQGGCMVVSLPHVAHNAVVAGLLNEDFAYHAWGLLDSTHIRFWGLKNMQKMFEDAGFKIAEAEFVVRSPEQTELAHLWHRLPARVRAELAWNRFGNVYQVVIRAVPQDAAGGALLLTSLPVPVPVAQVGTDASATRRLLRRMGSRLSPELQVRIVRTLRRLGVWP